MTPPASDPWKSFRGVMAATLILEIIVVLLALPVVASVGGGLRPASTGYLLGFAGLLVLLAGPIALFQRQQAKSLERRR